MCYYSDYNYGPFEIMVIKSYNYGLTSREKRGKILKERQRDKETERKRDSQMLRGGGGVQIT